MGGAYGHLMHLHEDRDLTFGELKSILCDAAAGRLEGCTEKTDGMNLVFTWDQAASSARVARSSGDIKRGGMDAAGLSARFADRSPWVKDTFASALSALNVALFSTLFTPEERARIFEGGTRWYSMEIIDADCPNVIHYDRHRSNIVFHTHGSFSVDPAGAIRSHPDAPGVQLLAERLDDSMVNGWFFYGPQPAVTGGYVAGRLLQGTIESIDVICDTLGLSDPSTQGALALRYARDHVPADWNLTPQASAMVAQRMSEVPGALSLSQIRKQVPTEAFAAISARVKENDYLHLVRPLEQVIHRFSVGTLCGLRSAMVTDHDAEVRRLRLEVVAASRAVADRGNAEAKKLLQRHLHKLGKLDNISSSAEGVVFRHGSKTYKLTGAFAPVNQILGLLRYGRGEAKVSETG